MKRLSFVAVVALLLPANILFAQDKMAIPDGDEAHDSLKAVHELYGDKYKTSGAIRSSTERRKSLSALAQEIHTTGKNTQASSDRYALLQVALRIAVEAGDAERALAVAASMYSSFHVDGMKLETDSLTKIANESAFSSTDHSAIVPHLFALIDKAEAADRYDLSKRLLGAALASARKARNGRLLKEAKDRGMRNAKIAKDYLAYKESLAILKDNPSDPDANLLVGTFLCCVKGDWKTGIGYLALGGDAALSDVAEMDLKESDKPSDANGQVAVGDAWWEVGSDDERFRQRSIYWFQIALPRLADGGLQKKLVQSKLDTLIHDDGTNGRKAHAEVERAKIVNPYLGVWKAKSGTITHIKADGVIFNNRSSKGSWLLDGGSLTIVWENGDREVLSLSDDSSTISSRHRRRNGKTGSSTWSRVAP